jgi:alanine dehydrogenase
VHFDHDDEDPRRSQVTADGKRLPLADFLAGHDIVVNCVLQDTDSPLTFLLESDLPAFTPGSLIVDVSCDEGMGFDWARPTSFTQPTFVVGDNVTYYGVDHSPSYLWNSATWEISEALLPHLKNVLSGPESWERSDTLRRAIEISDGVIRNPAILSFQDRAAEYPHALN